MEAKIRRENEFFGHRFILLLPLSFNIPKYISGKAAEHRVMLEKLGFKKKSGDVMARVLPAGGFRADDPVDEEIWEKDGPQDDSSPNRVPEIFGQSLPRESTASDALNALRVEFEAARQNLLAAKDAVEKATMAHWHAEENKRLARLAHEASINRYESARRAVVAAGLDPATKP